MTFFTPNHVQEVLGTKNGKLLIEASDDVFFTPNHVQEDLGTKNGKLLIEASDDVFLPRITCKKS